jgi:hypothetical protein
MKNVYPTIWPVNLSEKDYGRTLFRITIDDETVAMTFQEFKRRVLQKQLPYRHRSHEHCNCLQCTEHRLRSTTQSLRAILDDA